MRKINPFLILAVFLTIAALIPSSAIAQANPPFFMRPAADYSMKTTGQALGGGQWILRSNGYIGHRVNFPESGRYQIRIQARGELAGSALPLIQVRLDGRILGNFTVGNTAYQYFTYHSTVSAAAGSHLLQIGYMNDSGTRSVVLFNTEISMAASSGGAVCGNNIRESGEGCDDGNRVTEACAYGQPSCTVCASNCQTAAGAAAFCGDSAVNGPETCDDGSQNGQPNRCNATCSGTTAPVCGNSAVESDEECDDGNTSAGDGCSPSCRTERSGITPECGNGIVESGEQCDDRSGLCTERCAIAAQGRAFHACDCGPGAAADCVPGNDASGDGSADNPWRSYDRLQNAIASSACGDQFYFCEGGSFAVAGGTQWVGLSPRECADNPRVIGSYDAGSNGQKPLIRASGTIRAFDLGTFGVSGVSGLRIQDLRILCSDSSAACGGSNAAAVAAANGISEVLLDGLVIEGFNMGVHATPFEEDPSFILRKSEIRDSLSFGVLGEVGDDTQITDNLFDNNSHCTLNPPAGESGRCGFIRPIYVTPTGHSGFVLARNTLTNSSVTSDTGQCNDNAVHVRGGIGAVIEDNLVMANADRAPLPLCGGFRVYGHADGQRHECRDCVFRRNRVYNTSYGVHMGSWVGGVVENNVIALTNVSGSDRTGNAMGAIVLESRQGAEDSTSTGVTIRNNSLYLEDRGAPPIGIRISTSEGGGYRIVSNAIYLASADTSAACLYFDSAAIVSHVEVEDNNACYAGVSGEYARNAGAPQSLDAWRAATPHGDRSLQARFEFSAPDMPNHDLREAGALLTDSGHPTLSADSDMEGVPRPQGPGPDIGAFERAD